MSMHSHQAWEFLVVCGDSRLREMLNSAIQEFGGQANWTPDTTSALAYISRRKLDGIFVDMRVDGALKLVGSIRRGNSNRYSAVFACVAEFAETARLLNSGVSFIVHKVIDPQKVVDVLRSASQMMLMERQRYLRYPLTIPVTLKTPSNEQKAVTCNISRGGMAVLCSHSIEPGRAINFVLELPGGNPIQGQGEIAWSKTDGNMGIRFYLLADNIKRTLWNWIDEHGARSA